MLYDLIIIGAGPAGLSAGIYAARAKLNFIIIDKLGAGGQILNTSKIENYPGFPDEISGADLVSNMHRQSVKFGARFLTLEIKEIKIKDNIKIILATDNQIFESKTVIIASGASPKKLGILGEDKFYGKGVSYCATCDGSFFKDKTVAVFGGGDSAIEETLFLTKFVSKVFVIHRRDKLRAAQILQDRAFKNNKINFIWNTVPLEITGESVVSHIKLLNNSTNEKSELNIEGIFVFIGHQPNTDFVKNFIKLDDSGNIITNKDLSTNIDGIFAAGDVRDTYLRQVVTAVGDGALAVSSVLRWLAI